ncbi:heparan-alpha-glucosaminide N-acetyltransferase [Petroclostridium sp. X23]|uniref:heparan-alpha-glucosaminide N-acetyltransferase n=1 Tax=Petroclostridium sp. X23 TaxID=3045146 RepID=UPI0024AD9A0F|nr:heparan-alpha-glucosaminide N-acetyltransferase [Petroclostridium sp. X23]WHH59560.1 heparan-alpha-glucosaminide N-acetyltransferase [Petroclostridium sp. X23]
MQKNNRVWEIDFIRGTAIILMVIFHLIVDLKDFYSYDIEYLSGFWSYEGKLSAILFMLVSGVSCTFSKSNMKRGLKVFSFGLILTAVTYIFSPEMYIRFGILHFLGTSMILYSLINKLSTKLLLTASTLIIIIGNYFLKMTVQSPYLFVIGLTDKNFGSMDYYPLMPWLSVFIIGIVIGRVVYKERKSIFNFTLENTYMSFLGNHSLLIYLLHQPLLLATLYVLHAFK